LRQHSFDKKLQSQTVTREKLSKTICNEKVQIPKVQKDVEDLSQCFKLLGSSRVKAARKTLVKLTPGVTALDRRSSSASFRRSGFSGLGCDRLRWSAVKKLWT